MSSKKLDKIIHQTENYLECWKQFNNFVNLARTRKFNSDDDTQFLEVKSILVQELELILSAVEVPSPNRDDIHSLVGNAPSLRYLSEMNDGVLRNLENQWHKVYIGWHSILGQLKVRQREQDAKSGLTSMFTRKE